MAKGYWIVRVDVKNEDRMKPYAAASPAIYKKFGGRYLVPVGQQMQKDPRRYYPLSPRRR